MINKELIKQSKKGDKQAFQKIYQYLSRPLFAFIVSRTGNREDAKDILQEVFIDVWKGLSGFIFVSERKFYSFVFLITRRKIYQYYRTKKYNIEFDEKYITEIIETDYKENYHQLLAGISRLSEKDQTIIQLRFISDLSYSEIGKMLRISENTAKVRCHRAVQKLKKFINGKI